MDDKRLKPSNKNSFSELNAEEIRGWVIDRMTQIEYRIDNAITKHIDPKNVDAFENIILNSTIIAFGAKLKILRNIENFDKKIIEKIQLISNIRNAFAHLPLHQSAIIKFKKKEGSEMILTPTSVENWNYLNVMNSSGEIKQKKAHELFNEFITLNKEIRDYFDSNNR
ncbi:hypothetical protein G4D82_09700 [Flavobacterium sp. CYK-4]|uniref:hypothetical protein n=1 Tax=Flavobacterium lotistagni TaxID=2709660 RepID=UPI001409178A|nr:hypothetical protein [Flavobacterium lotistagni]NHM07493.1 hypothetical protein [Flavobacterium lotistagni]